MASELSRLCILVYNGTYTVTYIFGLVNDVFTKNATDSLLHDIVYVNDLLLIIEIM